MTFHDVMDDIIDIPIYPLEQGKKAKETPIRKEATRTADDKTHIGKIKVPRRKDPRHNYGLRSVKKRKSTEALLTCYLHVLGYQTQLKILWCLQIYCVWH